jgi:hypothetical protein
MPKWSSFSKTLGVSAGIGMVGWAAYRYWIRPWHRSWGSTVEEFQRSFPGDDLIPNAKLEATHSITIQAAVSKVWPWLAQIGQGRGGFYSYDWIENLMGLDIRSSDQILPEFQDIQVGEKIPLAPDGFGFPVALVKPERLLVLFGDTRLDPETIPTSAPGEYFAATWGFYLSPMDENTTRLIERFRADWNPSLKSWFFMRVFLEPGAFIMERKMLQGIKQRAEAHPQGASLPHEKPH